MTSAPTLFTLSFRRRAAALFAALCVLAAQVELLLPDEHAGEAAVQSVLGGVNEESPVPPVPHPGHSVYVDHCAHAHVFAVGALPNDAEAVDAVTGMPETATPRLTSISAPPHRRPPIA